MQALPSNPFRRSAIDAHAPSEPVNETLVRSFRYYREHVSSEGACTHTQLLREAPSDNGICNMQQVRTLCLTRSLCDTVPTFCQQNCIARGFPTYDDGSDTDPGGALRFSCPTGPQGCTRGGRRKGMHARPDEPVAVAPHRDAAKARRRPVADAPIVNPPALEHRGVSATQAAGTRVPPRSAHVWCRRSDDACIKEARHGQLPSAAVNGDGTGGAGRRLALTAAQQGQVNARARNQELQARAIDPMPNLM